MEKNSDTLRQHAWSSYWQSGALHSCAGSFAGNYEGAIASHWQRQLAELTDGSRVLDLATGNGALPLMIAERFGAQVRVDAVDLADIAPRWHDAATYPEVHFHSGTRMEHLPFLAGSFDRVFSQYGLEYARRPDAWLEAVRVLAPDGKLCCISHHADSVLVDVASKEVAELDWLLQESGLQQAANNVLPWLSAARQGRELRGNLGAETARSEYNQALQRVQQRIEASPLPDPLMDVRSTVHALLAGRDGVDEAATARAMAAYWNAVQDARLRAEELITHALTDMDIHSLWDALVGVRADRRLQFVELRQPEGIMGWAIEIGPA